MIYGNREEMRQSGWRFSDDKDVSSRCRQPFEWATSPTGTLVRMDQGPWLHNESCVRPRPPREDSLRSRTYKCSTHGSWLVLRELDGPLGPVRYWACAAEVNCSYKKPCKYQQRSPRAKAAQARAAKATMHLPWDNVLHFDERRMTT